MNNVYVKIGNSRYTVCFGECFNISNKAEICYSKRTIFISPKYRYSVDLLHLIIHEITHAYIYETQAIKPPYDEETVCEFMSLFAVNIITDSKYVYKRLINQKN